MFSWFHISFDADATSCYTEFSFFLGFLSARGTAARDAIYSEKENEYLLYSSINFPHCSTVTAASRVSANKCQVSYRVITYHIVTILSCLCYNLNGQKVIEYYKHFVNKIIKCLHLFGFLKSGSNSVGDFSIVQDEIRYRERKHRQMQRCNIYLVKKKCNFYSYS